MLLRALAYKVHPYRWATIGLTPDHIARSDARRGAGLLPRPLPPFERHSVDLGRHRRRNGCSNWPKSGSHPLADRPADAGPHPVRNPHRPKRAARSVERDVPAHDGHRGLPHGRAHGRRTSTSADLVSDLLAGGDSARLYTHLVKEQPAAARSVNAYITGDVDPGAVRLHGPAAAGDDARRGRSGLPRRNRSAANPRPRRDYEIEKVKNKFEANTLFGELNVMNKAMNLGFYEMLGDLALVNREVAASTAPSTTDDIRSTSAAARSGPKTVPPSFTTRKQMTQPPLVTPADRRGPAGRKDARSPNGVTLYTLASDDFEVLRITFVFRAGSARAAGALLGIGGGQSCSQKARAT